MGQEWLKANLCFWWLGATRSWRSPAPRHASPLSWVPAWCSCHPVNGGGTRSQTCSPSPHSSLSTRCPPSWKHRPSKLSALVRKVDSGSRRESVMNKIHRINNTSQLPHKGSHNISQFHCGWRCHRQVAMENTAILQFGFSQTHWWRHSQKHRNEQTNTHHFHFQAQKKKKKERERERERESERASATTLPPKTRGWREEEGRERERCFDTLLSSALSPWDKGDMHIYKLLCTAIGTNT